MLQTEIIDIIEKFGGFRQTNQDCIFDIGGQMRTWTEMGGDARVVFELYGKWYSDDEIYSEYDCFEDYFWEVINDSVYGIKDWVRESLSIPIKYDSDKEYSRITDKVVKSVAYGSTFKQILAFIHNEENRLYDESRDTYE